MPSTDKLELSVEASEAAVRSEQGRRDQARFVDVGRLRQLQRDVEWAKRRLGDGQQRDRLQALRPEGCWCLGIGGDGRRFRAYGDVSYFERYCECPEGQAARQEDESAAVAAAEARHRERVERHLEAATIPTRFYSYSFASYPVSDATRQSVEWLKHWSIGPGDGAQDDEWDQWGKLPKSVLLHGLFGTGKTGLAIAALKGRIRVFGEAGLFTTVPMLLDEIRRGYNADADDESRKLLERVKTIDNLVLDDIGAERVTDWVAERLFVIINHRHDDDLTTIFTSNLSPPELGAHIGERTMWRIVEMCEVVKLDGPNLRDRKAG